MPRLNISPICEFCKRAYVVPSLARDCELDHIEKEAYELDSEDSPWEDAASW